MTSAYGPVSASDPDLQQRVASAPQTLPIDGQGPIGLVGCGWIGGLQLAAYRASGFEVVAICDRTLEKAVRYRDEYFPEAGAYASLDEMLQHPSLGVVDIATHVDGRPDTVRRCLEAGLPVLSQKPFVEDLEVGAELSRVARGKGVTLAVNQNGRWAPHFGAMLAFVRAGLIGDVVSADFQVTWPHDQVVAEMPAFASMQDLILFDFGAHWFDVIGVLAPATALRASAHTGTRAGQQIPAPLQASAIVSGEGFMATVDFRAGERFAEVGSYRVAGTKGVITHTGRSLGGDSVSLYTAYGEAVVAISDDWFTHGLAGTMRALLESLSTGRPAPHSAESAMVGLTIAFAAAESARTGAPVEVGSARTR